MMKEVAVLDDPRGVLQHVEEQGRLVRGGGHEADVAEGDVFVTRAALAVGHPDAVVGEARERQALQPVGPPVVEVSSTTIKLRSLAKARTSSIGAQLPRI